MLLPLETPATKSQESLSLSEEGTTLESEEIRELERSREDLTRGRKAEPDSREVRIFRLRSSKKRYERKYKGAKERVAELEHKIGKVSKAHEETLEKVDKRIQAMEYELATAKELLAARSTELSAAKSFLSIPDPLSEADVLDMVRDLNTNIINVAASLTEKWKNSRSLPPHSDRYSIPQANIHDHSRIYGPVLVRRSIGGDPAAVDYLIRSCLCLIVTEIISSWRHDCGKESEVLRTVYERLSASEEQRTVARWRSLTHCHLVKPPSDDPTSITERIANLLWITGTFRSSQRSFDFVKQWASNGIETVGKLARRLEAAFMVDITSTDLCLLFEWPHADFDKRKMINVSDPDESLARRRQAKVAGTIAVGVRKSVGGRHGTTRHTVVLLKAKVVLERNTETEGESSCIVM